MLNKYITNWIPADEAKMIVLKHIVDGKYKKGQIGLSSRRWADPSDHSKGYLARVYVEGGIHPELELGDTGRKTAATSTPAVTVLWNPEVMTGSNSDECVNTMVYYNRENVDEVKSA
jgi:hypothetical protein